MDTKDRSSSQQLFSNLIVYQLIHVQSLCVSFYLLVSCSNDISALKWKFKEDKLGLGGKTISIRDHNKIYVYRDDKLFY